MTAIFADRKTRRLLASVVAVFLGVTVPLAVASVSGGFPAPSDVQNEPVATGPSITVATGRTGSYSWRIVANESDQGLCVHLELVSPDRARTGGCGAGLAAGGVGLLTASVPSGATWVFGPVDAGAKSVDVAFAGGTSVRTRPVSGRGLGMNFYVAARAAEMTPAAVVARAGNGVAVGRQEVG